LDRCVDNFFAETEQVAFCTQNIVPGIDFSNDPLLQGRNFSYLDTQVKRLGGPNFTYIPINAPKCPFRTLQQDGHMAMANPSSRVNYEPNSWGGELGGPRESPERGFESYPAPEEGPKLRSRSETFADHYSQARQFYISQTKVEQNHIAASFIFELSKVENPAIRSRLVSHLMNVDQGLADMVTKGLRLPAKPKAAEAARTPRTDLKESAALSIIRNAAGTFHGRKVGALVTDGVNAELVKALKKALEQEGALIEFIAPAIGGVQASDSSWIEAGQAIDGGPSVLYDAVALLVSEAGTKSLMDHPALRDFIADAYAHAKFIAYVDAAKPLIEKAVGVSSIDDGFIAVNGPKDTAGFVNACRQLRFWAREEKNAKS
jgi:catalase